MKNFLIPLTLSLLCSSVPGVECEDSRAAAADEEDTRRTHLRRGLDLTLGGPPGLILGEITSGPDGGSPEYSSCVPAVIDGATLGGDGSGFLGDKCAANSDCPQRGSLPPCCVQLYCRCEEKEESFWTCLEENVTPPTPPPTPTPAPTPSPTAAPTPAPTPDEPQLPGVAELVVAWRQCTDQTTCDSDNGYLTDFSCESDADCPSGESCSVWCAGMDFYCYDPDASGDKCTKTACDNDSVTCPDGSECVDEFSDECGPWVCKDMGKELWGSCTGVPCVTSTDCSGSALLDPNAAYECVPEWNPSYCGFQ